MVTSNQASNLLEIWKSEVRASMAAIPTDLLDLLERRLYAHLATTRPDGTVQVSPMWFDWDGERLRFSTTTTRQKYRNVQSHPHVAASISDPENPYRFLEVRGVVEEIEPDPAAEGYMRINNRYGRPFSDQAPPDATDRVVIVVRPTGSSKYPKPWLWEKLKS